MKQTIKPYKNNVGVGACNIYQYMLLYSHVNNKEKAKYH